MAALAPDTMKGNAGNDTYIVDDAADQVIEVANEGIDLDTPVGQEAFKGGSSGDGVADRLGELGLARGFVQSHSQTDSERDVSMRLPPIDVLPIWRPLRCLPIWGSAGHTRNTL
jgi:hypothetical protein